MGAPLTAAAAEHKPMNTTCLIPCYNERMRIAQVLEEVTKIKSVTQIICIDDGSTDGTAAYVKAYWPEVELVQLEQNQGKAAAIQHGVKAATNELILMMDADLQGLKQEEIQDAIDVFREYTSIDMIILRRINSPWFVRWYRSDILLSGERLLLKKDLEKVLEQDVNRYQLEVAINRYMINSDKQVRWMPCTAINTYKVDKWGVWGGSRREFKMYLEIVYYVGLVHMMIQLSSFTKEFNPEAARKRRFRSRLLSQLKLGVTAAVPGATAILLLF